MIDLSGKWKLTFENKGDAKKTTGDVMLPGTMQAQGFGEEITYSSDWISGLHCPFWYEREEYSFAGNEDKVPFLAQPPLLYRGKAVYERVVLITEENDYTLFLEVTHWRVKAYVDGVFKGEIVSLLAPFEFHLGVLNKGTHVITIEADNSLQYPYRPDGHGVSDALAAGWNGIGGEITLLTEDEITKREEYRKEYAKKHKREITTRDGKFLIDGKFTYLRGTHYGGDHPLTDLPDTGRGYWEKMFNTLREYGFNFLRCHSYCPTDSCFLVADEMGFFIQVECDMWNIFNEGIEMNDVLKKETERVLKYFGHHPSFVLFSPTNEPGSGWHAPLKEWVKFARETDKKLGYEGRRLYTAQSGWHYDTVPAETDSVDYLFLHKTKFGDLGGGIVRGFQGWKGKDYDTSLEGAKIPAVCHELGQWCAYPDFSVVDKFTGYIKPGMYEIFKENAKKNGVLKYNKEFAHSSGHTQMLFMKEDLEANYRTKYLQGYEYLDTHDYLGQGGALIGFLDAFWDNKGYTTPEELREIVSDTVILTRLPSYVYKNTDKLSTVVTVCHYGEKELKDAVLSWKLAGVGTGISFTGEIHAKEIPAGGNTDCGYIDVPLERFTENGKAVLEITLSENKKVISKNRWNITVFAENDPEEAGLSDLDTALSDLNFEKDVSVQNVRITRNIDHAEIALKNGEKVVFMPYMSDLSYDCPALSFRNVFWNAQMGPNWVRNLGLLIDKDHPLFKRFPTDEYSDWQWEDVLRSARGIKTGPDMKTIVRPIDDWNRNFSLSLIFEGKAFKGQLITVSADLLGSFDERPAANALFRAIVGYAASPDFKPENVLDFDDLKNRIRELRRGSDVIERVKVRGVEEESEDLLNELTQLKNINPNTSCLLKPKALPVSLEVVLKGETTVHGLIVLCPQADRNYLGIVKDYRLFGKFKDGSEKLLSEGVLRNCFDEQIISFEPFRLTALRLEVLSTYGRVICTRYKKEFDGWNRYRGEDPLYIQIGVINILTDGVSSHDDERFWSGKSKRRTEEIDI